MPNRIRITVLALLLIAPIADAGMLYKCSSAKGAVTIQSDPCPTGSTEIWKRDSAPAPQQSLQQVVANSVQRPPTTGGVRAAPPSNTPVPQVAGSVPAPVAVPAPIATTPAAPMSVAPTPPPVAPPPVAMFPPPAATPSTMTLQWHDEPETPTGQPATNTDCDSAKAFAHSAQEKIWLGLTQDQTQRLYGWVMDQCDGR